MKALAALVLCALAPNAADAAVSVKADPDAVAQAAADTLVEVVAAAKAEGRKAHVALSGGSTPKKLFALLAGRYAGRIDWDHVELYFSDERGVGPTHPDSNFGVASALFIGRVPIPPGQVHRIAGETEDLDTVARAYERTIAERIGAGKPAFDLVWLGVGGDGHTASLFPGSHALRSRRMVVATMSSDGKRRISFTPYLLGLARRVQFLVTGQDKALVLSQIHGGRRGPSFPAKIVARRLTGRVDWIVDHAAASLMKSPTAKRVAKRRS